MSARILIVEDEESLTLLLRYNLEKEGYAVEAVARGDEAEIRLKERAPDLVLLDWMLPGVSGIELCRRLRARPETKSLPIIMLTARGEEFDRIRGLATGADDYVVKPFSVPELMARVKAALRRANPHSIGAVLRRRRPRTRPRNPPRPPLRRGGSPRPDRVPPSRVPDADSRPRLQPRAASHEHLGRSRLRGRAHGRRFYWPPPKSPQQHLRPRPNPHGPGVRLCIRRALRTGRLSRCAVIWRRMAASGTPQT